MKPKLYMIISMTIFGTIGIFRRLLPIPSGELAFYRAALAIVLLIGYLLIKREKIEWGKIKKVLLPLVLSGVAMGFNWILLFEAYNWTSVSVATLSYYFAPILVTALSPIIFKEKMTLKNFVCFLGATAGVVMIILTGSVDLGLWGIFGILFGLGAAVLYATVILLNKAIKEVGGIQRTFLQFLSALFVLLPYVMLTTKFSGEIKGYGIIALLIVGFVHTGVTYCLYFSSLKDLKGSTAAILSYIDPLVAVICSVTLLGEPLTIWQAFGGVLILGCTFLSEMNFTKRQR